MGRARTYRVLIAGGGTGGHLFPGLAVAEALQQGRPDVQVRFAGSRYGIEHRVVPRQGYHLYRIPVRGLYHVPWRRRLWVVAMLPVALLKSAWVLLTWRPHLVLGVGGYASAPVLAAALLLRRRTAIQEQNAYPGMTNRLLGRYVDRAFVPVEGLEALLPGAVVTGNPVRRDILALRHAPAPPRPVPQVFVLGGSQGARRVNEAMCDALPRLAAAGVRMRIVHQTGSLDLQWVREGYAGLDLDAEVTPFIEDVAAVYRDSRIVVSRAGASAVSEIVTARRAAILVPIPGTSGDHQRRNAQRLEQAGAAVLLEQAELSGESLAGHLLSLLEDPQRLDAMERACDRLFPGDAAAQIAGACLALMGADGVRG